MKPPWKIPLALAGMSLLFFCTAIPHLLDSGLLGHGTNSGTIPLSSAIWHTLFGLIALGCGIAFLIWTRGENPSWYLGIPLVLAFAVLVMAPLGRLLVTCDPDPLLYFLAGIGSLLSAFGPLFLPPCAALFFWSQKHLGRGVTVITGATMVITLSAIFFVFYILFFPGLVAAGLIPPAQPLYIDGHPAKSEMGWAGAVLFLILKYIGPLVIGICFLVLAALSWQAARRTGPVPPASGAAP